jgi:hypothetical protein
MLHRHEGEEFWHVQAQTCACPPQVGDRAFRKTAEIRPRLLGCGREGRQSGRALGGADEVAQVDHELPAKAANCEGGGLGEERSKQHHRNRYAYENGKGRVQK